MLGSLGRTFVPLLQLLLVEMGSFLQVGQLLLGQLALAIVSYNQLLALKAYVVHIRSGAKFLFELSDGIGEGPVACRLVVRVASVVVVGDLGMVEARKVEGRTAPG